MAHAHDMELAKLARSLENKTSEAAVHDIVSALVSQAQLSRSRTPGAGGGPVDSVLAAVVENLRLDMRGKTSRADVLRLTAAVVEQMSAQLAPPPNDTLMAATVPLRCISCGQVDRRQGMHNNVAEHIVHDGLTSDGGVAPQQRRAGAPQGGGGPRQTHAKRSNQLVMATYPNGRAGALRPLQPQGAPMWARGARA